MSHPVGNQPPPIQPGNYNRRPTQPPYNQQPYYQPAPQPQPMYQQQYQQPPQNTQVNVVIRDRKSNGMGTAGFILALIGLFFSWVPIAGWIIWFLGALFSFIGLFKEPRGLAIAGFIISFIDILILILFFSSLFAAIGALAS